MLFRSMKKTRDGLPMCGENARCLGVRKSDITIDKNDRVVPDTGGMSVFENPEKLPKHRKPVWMEGGIGRDPLFRMNQNLLPKELTLRCTGNDGHALVEPAYVCKYLAYSSALCGTRTSWAEVLCPNL